MQKTNFITSLKQFLEPKVGSTRWYKKLLRISIDELEDIRETYAKDLFDPSKDMNWKTYVRDVILKNIDQIKDRKSRNGF